jgi:tetratricopeptide (TPR) repeat protein
MLEETIVKDSHAFEHSHLTTIYLHLASAYLQQKQIAKAQDANFEAIKKNPNGMSTLEFIAKSYRDQKQHVPFVALLERVTQELSGNGTLYALMGETLSESMQQHESAIVAYKKAIVLEPNRSDLYNGYGLALYRMKKYKEALAQFSTAIQVDPDDATAKYNQACALSLLGRKNEALAALAEALVLDPRLQESARKDADFAQIQNLQKFRELVHGEPHFAGEDEKNGNVDILGH